MSTNKVDELYQEYLTEKLDLVFGGDGERTQENKLGGIIVKDWLGCPWKAPEKQAKKSGVRVSKNKDDWHRRGNCLVNAKGQEISATYDHIYDSSEGFFLVKNNFRYNFMNQNGKLLSSVWFSEPTHFDRGHAKVRKGWEYNYIDSNGQLLSKEWLQELHDFCEGYARVRIKGKGCNFMDYNGNMLSIEWYDYAEDFSEGYAMIRKNDKANFIDRQGKVLSVEWYDYAEDFSEGYAKIRKNDKWNFLDQNGKVLSPEWFDDINNFCEGKAYIRQDDETRLIDRTGKIFSVEEYYKHHQEADAKKHKEDAENTDYWSSSDIDDYDIEKTLTGYKCRNKQSGQIYKLPFKPVKSYGIRYLLCTNMQGVYLYDCIAKKNIYLGKCSNVVYDDNFIIALDAKKVYLMYEAQMIDITEYYMTHLCHMWKIRINSGVGLIYSREQFESFNYSKIEQILAEERKNNQKIAQELAAKREQKEKLKEIEEIKKKEQQRNDKRDELLKTLQVTLQKLQTIPSKDIGKIRVQFDGIFINDGDHMKINPMFYAMLRYIDLSSTSFDNVDVSGIDFRGCNIGIMFKPQLVYNKDLSGCDFDKIYISPFVDFTGVDIRGCHFSADEDPQTIDMFNPTFQNAIYDETTTYNGVSFKKIIGKSKNNGKKQLA